MFIGINHHSIALGISTATISLEKKPLACALVVGSPRQTGPDLHDSRWSDVFGSLGHGIYTIQFFKLMKRQPMVVSSIFWLRPNQTYPSHKVHGSCFPHHLQVRFTCFNGTGSNGNGIEPHKRLMVVAGTWYGKPARTYGRRYGYLHPLGWHSHIIDLFPIYIWVTLHESFNAPRSSARTGARPPA